MSTVTITKSTDTETTIVINTTSRETPTEKVETVPTGPIVTRTGKDKSTTGTICIIE